MSRVLVSILLMVVIAGCTPINSVRWKDHSESLIEQLDWPIIAGFSRHEREATELQVLSLLSKMTLEEKVGQMIQPELQQVTPEEAAEYRLGSLLNGGGSWPNKNKHSTVNDWVSLADKYWLALDKAYDKRGFKVPFMWATDAVHGHNNAYGGTLYPHNIGLGAANDSDLIYRVAQATTKEVLATGLDWTFAPTVAVPRNDRWGRAYEGYSEDPERVYQYAARIVKGLQGNADELSTDRQLISTVKHWVGDGGTDYGKDRGNNQYSEHLLRNIHASGYFSGLQAGAQAVMVSFNKWKHLKDDKATPIHGSHYLITDVLKNKMGFDGVVISDWNGHEALKGCTKKSCAKAVSAGIDIIMVTANADWKAFHKNLIQQVKNKQVSMSRIDDAVTRILRMKVRAGLWSKPRPSKRYYAGKSGILGSPAHRSLAREAVRKSLVLLKNNDSTLPLSQSSAIFLAGSGADDISRQVGGWSLTWQGTKNKRTDFPNAETVKESLLALLGQSKVVTDLSKLGSVKTAIVVISEKPYAEFFGDIKLKQSLQFSTLKEQYAQDFALLKSLKKKGLKVVTVILSGRPLYINDVLNESDALIAAWLPGTEAGGITDLLFKNKQGEIAYDFQGKLSYSWPNHPCSAAINRIPKYIKEYKTPKSEQALEGVNKPLFAYGYGLKYNSGPNTNLSLLEVDVAPNGCGK